MSYGYPPQPAGGAYGGPVPLSQPLYGATIGEAAGRFWKKYATFAGRASRSEYWWWTLVSLLVAIVFQVVSVVTVGSWTEASRSRTDLGDILDYVWSLITLIPGLALSWRRLHDINRSGLWILIALIPVVGTIIILVFYATGPNPDGARFDA